MRLFSQDMIDQAVASEEDIREVIKYGEPVVTSDKAKDGAECTVTAYHYEGKTYITDVKYRD